MIDPATEAAVRQFLDRFTSGAEGGDTEALGDCVAEVFIAADANAARAVPRSAFLSAVPRRRQMFADAGVGRAVLDSHTVQLLDDHHLLVRTEWTAPRVDGSEPLHLSSSFLLRRDGDVLTALVYLNHRGL
jgi:hypothetical protein